MKRQHVQPTQPTRLRSLTVALMGILAILSLLLTACSTSNTKSGGGLGNDTISTIKAATTGGGYKTPLDAAPDPDGKTIYFTATGAKGQGVFKVATAGGDAQELFSGAPFVTPQGIAVATDGQVVYVADMGADKGGAILKLPVAGGAPSVVAGTAGTAPRNLDILKGQGGDTLYFTGTDGAKQQPALFSLAAGATTATVVFAGAPLVEPDGVAVSKAGVAYIADRSGKVLKVAAGQQPSVVVASVKTGSPAGIAMTSDDGVLVVSAIDAKSLDDRVMLVNVADNKTGTVDKVVGQNNNSSGGVHRALNTNQFAWADRSGGKGGSGKGNVYAVAP